MVKMLYTCDTCTKEFFGSRKTTENKYVFCSLKCSVERPKEKRYSGDKFKEKPLEPEYGVDLLASWISSKKLK